MFTVCPKCALTLVVTAADLRVAQGYVRCGRCLNVFNALARLSEERPSAAPASAEEPPADGSQEQVSSAEPPASDAPPPPPDDAGEIEIELDASVLVTSGPASAASAPQERPASEEGPAESPEAARSEEPLAAHADALAAEAHGQPAETPAGDAAEAPEMPASAHTAPRTAATPQAAETLDGTQPPEAQQTNAAPQPMESAFELETRPPRAPLAWKLGAGALAIALALQIVNHYRDALAADPALGRPLTAAYSALGVKIAPRWNIHAYDVRQLGASVASAAAGEIIVRASVMNSASRAQPLPLLRVTLQDRFGNRIAARDVAPGDYVPSPVAPGSLLAAGSRVDATMVFVDPGPQAVGFEIDACLRQRGGEVMCAHGP